MLISKNKQKEDRTKLHTESSTLRLSAHGIGHLGLLILAFSGKWQAISLGGRGLAHNLASHTFLRKIVKI